MEPHERLATAMRLRMAALHIKTLRELATLAGISYETLRSARSGESEPSEGTKSGLERALRWTYGSIDAILAGGEPTPVGDEAGSTKRPDRLTNAMESLRRAEESLATFRKLTADPEVAAAVRRAIARGAVDTAGPDSGTDCDDERRDTA